MGFHNLKQCRRRLIQAANTSNADKYREIERKETNVMEITDRECKTENWTAELIFKLLKTLDHTWYITDQNKKM